MSSTASNYDMFKLTFGQSIAVLAAGLALSAATPIILQSFISSIPLLLITIAYAVMMFASSYVEEEHHFWYWATSGWLAMLSLKGYDLQHGSLYFADVLQKFKICQNLFSAQHWRIWHTWCFENHSALESNGAKVRR